MDEMMLKMLVFFIGHGGPENALLDNAYTRTLENIGKTLTPKAILVISGHWLTNGTYVNTAEKPETIYDFYGFPEKMYKIKYPAPGAKSYAEELIRLLPDIKADDMHGLDHGTWTVLLHMFPKAVIPVFQMSIDYDKPMKYHYGLARKLKFLRDKGVLIIASGNIVHNLQMYFGKKDNSPYDWAIKFDEWVKEKLTKKDHESLIDYQKAGKSAELSVPEPSHYIPLIYALGATDKDEKITFIYEEVTSSMSMMSFRIG